jgi:hypothetical protein
VRDTVRPSFSRIATSIRLRTLWLLIGVPTLLQDIRSFRAVKGDAFLQPSTASRVTRGIETDCSPSLVAFVSPSTSPARDE